MSRYILGTYCPTRAHHDLDLLFHHPFDLTKSILDAMDSPRSAEQCERRCFGVNNNLGMKVTQDDSKYEVAMDVPGMKVEDIDIQLNERGKILQVKGERKTRDEQKKTVHTFAKSISLGDDIDTQSLSAAVVDGVLVITAEKLKKEEKEEEWMKIDVVDSKN